MALAKDRNTKTRAPGNWAYKMAAAKVYQGGIVALNAAGFAVPGATATTLTALGVAQQTVDNSGGSAGDKRVEVQRGCFFLANSGGDPVVQADVGKPCYIVDDETVAHSNGTNTRSVAGIVREVETGGVWVEF